MGEIAIKIFLQLAREYQGICVCYFFLVHLTQDGWMDLNKIVRGRSTLLGLCKYSGYCKPVPTKRDNFRSRHLMKVHPPINDGYSKGHALLSSTHLQRQRKYSLWEMTINYSFAPKDLKSHLLLRRTYFEPFFRLWFGTSSGTQGEGNWLVSKSPYSHAEHREA